MWNWGIVLPAKNLASTRGGGLRVLVVAASAVRRAGLDAMLRSRPGMSAIGSISQIASLDSQVRQIQPDVVIVDVAGPDPHVLAAIRNLPPHSSAVILLADEPDAQWCAAALRAGVRGILPREATQEEIEAAVQAAHLGLIMLDPELTAEILNHVKNESDTSPPQPLGELTARETEVLRFLAEGAANKEIAQRLGISDHTVKFHISAILAKLGAASRTEALTLGIRMGLITI